MGKDIKYTISIYVQNYYYLICVKNSIDFYILAGILWQGYEKFNLFFQCFVSKQIPIPTNCYLLNVEERYKM